MTTNNSEQSLPEQFDLGSSDIAADQREKLRKLFPEVFTEGGKVDFDRLKATLGEIVDSGHERYGMNWPGKSECFRAIQTPSRATLRPCREESVNFDTTENLIIEGDNLEVLKLLQKGYLGKVKMIYIDPPYNTGNDFIYPDNYSESLETYLAYTGQVDATGKKFSTNPETDGRFHSKWMNMMYPRLFLARNLLREDGVIFISIDDHEVDNLRKLCNEIFGEENFIANVIWQKKYTRSNDAKYFSDNHDHILIYARNRDAFKLNLLPRNVEQESAYSNPDDHPKGPWKATPLHAKSGNANDFSYTFDNGVIWHPPNGTFPRFSTETLKQLDANDEIWFGEDGKAMPSRKTFLSEAKAGVTPVTIWTYDEVGHNHEANGELKVLGLGGAFDNPKPMRLIQRMLELSTSIAGAELILDFFSGSGTTAHAVLELNKHDGGNRKFILVQLPEPTGREDYKTIADITKERVRRVINKMNNEDDGKLDLQGGPQQDRGFRVFKLDTSNFRPWDGTRPETADGVVRQLELHIDHVLPDRSQADILTEILLKSGFPLSTKVEVIELANKQVFSIERGAMLICLEDNLTSDVIKAMADMKPERVICLDAGFQGNDQLKTNAVQTMKARGVVKFQTV